MSSGEKEIVCRRCRKSIPADGGTCPHCGASIRNSTGPIAAVALGILVGIASAFAGLWFFAAIGLIIAGIGGYIIYDKRRRIQEAQQGTGSISDLTNDAET